ncbi:hypothetical protein PG987_008143 [Apiospora arundinis]
MDDYIAGLRAIEEKYVKDENNMAKFEGSTMALESTQRDFRRRNAVLKAIEEFFQRERQKSDGKTDGEPNDGQPNDGQPNDGQPNDRQPGNRQPKGHHHRLESTFQPNHDIAEMINNTRPVPKSMEDTITRLSSMSSSVATKLNNGYNHLPEKDAIAYSINEDSETMETMMYRLSEFASESWAIPNKLRQDYSKILKEVQHKSGLSWYSMEHFVLPTNAFRRQQWIDVAVASSVKIEELAEDAERIRRVVSNIEQSMNQSVRRMRQSQWHHQQEVKRLQSRWYYRFNIFATPIIEENCEEEIRLMIMYVDQIGHIKKGLKIRIDTLMDASESLGQPQAPTWADGYFDSFHHFERRYQAMAEQMVRHLAQAIHTQSSERS